VTILLFQTLTIAVTKFVAGLVSAWAGLPT
jgi:hypothetical protein